MNFIKNIAIAIVALGALCGIFALFHGGSPVRLGSSGNASETYYNSQWLVGGNQIGPTGTLNLNTQFGTCNLIGTSAGITATTTKNFDCAVAGILPGDTVIGDPSALMSAGVLGDIYPVRAVASSTAGFITFTLLNLSGAASTTLGSNVASSTEYFSAR